MLILASGSPRRRELLRLTGLPYETTAVDIDESPQPNETARAYTARLSREKALAAQQTLDRPALILAADTTVADGDDILGKPADVDEARAMLQRLRGRAHQVYTALTVLDTMTGRHVTDVAVTDVPMRDYTDAAIDAYIASGDPFDKAGGYAIQHAGFRPVNLTHGCFSNVVGLPLCHLVRVLREFGVVAAADTPQRCIQYQAYDCDVSSQVLEGTPSDNGETNA
ncbi:MAG: Maf family protein [Anaerolineae bacterium]|nr:Maf family protein [Anaerolineae bacterium]